MSESPFNACGLGQRTVIFGRNGSGKTTLSEAMRSSEASVDYAWVDRVIGPTAQIFVFNRFYVQDSLAEFVDGDGSAAAILKVGESNVRLAREESDQVALNERNRRWLGLIAGELIDIDRNRSSALQRLKTSVINVLGSRDGAQYNTQAYTIRNVKGALERTAGSPLTDEAFATACEVIGLTDAGARIAIDPVPEVAQGFLDELRHLEAYSPVASTIESLAANSVLARWVESGLDLHSEGRHCEFCADGVLSATRLDELRGHFSDDLASFRVRLQQHGAAGAALLERSKQWSERLPAIEAFEPSLRSAAHDEVLRLRAGVEAQVEFLKQIIAIIARIAENPFARRKSTTLSLPIVRTDELAALVSQSNSALDSLASRKKAALVSIEDHLISREQAGYREGFRREERLRRLEAHLERVLSKGIIRARTLHAEQQDTTAMAAEIDADLRAHFGHAHLAVAATTDGKGYVVQRNGVPARTLSEGERNAVALSYFLQSLHGADSALDSAVVVIDDPITSLDREAMFAAYSLIEERAADAGQLIVLTHDFEYFRLLLQGLSSRWGKSQRRIKERDQSEIDFPAVAVLEVRAVGAGDARLTEIQSMPSVVVQRASEYHYLFWRISQAIGRGDVDNLPILGNAARRLIEGFISFKAPHGNSFQEKVDHVRNTYRVDPVLARRVVKFLHGHSHREELRPTSAIDFPSVEAELKMAMEFIHSADREHYRDMCKATAVENTFV